MQLITGYVTEVMTVSSFSIASGSLSLSAIQNSGFLGTSPSVNRVTVDFNSANSPNARTGPKTEMESGTVLVYMYTGEYTA